MKEVVLDTETTGLSVKEGHRIVEIGCIELDNLVPTNNQFHCYLNPNRKVSEKALEVHALAMLPKVFLHQNQEMVDLWPTPRLQNPLMFRMSLMYLGQSRRQSICDKGARLRRGRRQRPGEVLHQLNSGSSREFC